MMQGEIDLPGSYVIKVTRITLMYMCVELHQFSS